MADKNTGIYIIYSKWTLRRIDEAISKYGKVGLLRIINDGVKETNRTLVLMENEVYFKLINAGYSGKNNKGLSITAFNEKALDFPGKNFNSNLFVTVPEVFKSDDLNVIKIVEGKLKHLVEWDILPDNCWTINVPVKSREKGGISSGCFIIFDKEIEISVISKARMLLTDNNWPATSEQDEKEAFKCVWGLNFSKNKKFAPEKKSEKRKAPVLRRKLEKSEESTEDVKVEKRKAPVLRRKLEKSEESTEDVQVETTKIPIPTFQQPSEIPTDIVLDSSI